MCGGPTIDQLSASIDGKYGTNTSAGARPNMHSDVLYLGMMGRNENPWGYYTRDVSGGKIWCAFYSGVFTEQTSTNPRGVRALLKLPSDVKMMKDDNGKWTFSQ